MLWIVSLAVTMPSCQDLTLGFSNQVPKRLTRFARTEDLNNNWLYPRVCFIARVVKHLEVCQARGTLIVPLWKSSFFWNSCSKDGVHWSSFVIDWVYLPKFQGLFIKGQARNSLFGSKPLNFYVVALIIDFSRPRPPSSLRGYCTLPPGECSSCS